VPSEARRGIVRIAANYTRLLSNVVLGLVSVKILVGAAGNDGWALISTLGATTGIANLTEESVRRSMIRELGAALHSDDPQAFPRTFNTAMLVSSGMSLVTLASFGVIALCVALNAFTIPAALISAALWLVGFKAVESFFDVILSPIFNVYIASERMRAFNGWVMAQRLARLASALWLLWMIPKGTPVDQILKTYAWVGAALYIGVNVLACLTMVLFVDPRTRPRPWLARRAEMKGLVAVGKWNMAMTTAQNLHLRADQIITNIIFGLAFNAPFGFAMQLTSYVRMLTVGMTDGLDAATARITSKKGEQSVRELIRHSTRLHAFVSIPTGIGLAILARPALDLWVGNNVQNRTVVIPQAALIMQIIVLGVTCRAISDGWIRILYGAGHIRSYAIPIVLWSIANPALAVALSHTLPAGIAPLGPAIAFSAVTLILSLVVVPVVGARCLGLTTAALVAPALRPALIAVIASPILFLADHLITTWNTFLLGAVCATYAAVVTTACIAFAMTRDERARFSSAILRRIRRRGPQRRSESTPQSPAPDTTSSISTAE
jgi:O-antigen/teichoic acid export membrane protein